MKPERVVTIWVAVLFACVAWLMGSLIPWPAKLRDPWSPGDWASWLQAVGSVGALVASYMLAKQSHQQSRALLAEQEIARTRKQEDALAVLLHFFIRALRDMHRDASAADVAHFKQNLELLQSLIARGAAAQLELVSASVAWEYLEGQRIAIQMAKFAADQVAEVERRMLGPSVPGLRFNLMTTAQQDELVVADMGLRTVVASYERRIGRSLAE